MSLIRKILISLVIVTSPALAQYKPVKKNRVALGAGLGTDGILYNRRDNVVKERFGTVISIDYDRKFENSNTIGISIISNKTFIIKIGKEF